MITLDKHDAEFSKISWCALAINKKDSREFCRYIRLDTECLLTATDGKRMHQVQDFSMEGMEPGAYEVVKQTKTMLVLAHSTDVPGLPVHPRRLWPSDPVMHDAGTYKTDHTITAIIRALPDGYFPTISQLAQVLSIPMHRYAVMDAPMSTVYLEGENTRALITLTKVRTS